MKAYKKGRKFEYELMELFRNNGYEVSRTAGSHSPFDIIAIKYTQTNKRIAYIVFIQAKIKKLKDESS